MVNKLPLYEKNKKKSITIFSNTLSFTCRSATSLSKYSSDSLRQNTSIGRLINIVKTRIFIF